MCTCNWYFIKHSEFYVKNEVSNRSSGGLPKMFFKMCLMPSSPKFVFQLQVIQNCTIIHNCHHWAKIWMFSRVMCAVFCVWPSFLPDQFYISNSVVTMHHHFSMHHQIKCQTDLPLLVLQHMFSVIIKLHASLKLRKHEARKNLKESTRKLGDFAKWRKQHINPRSAWPLPVWKF